jgi:hypothetical protein
MLLAIEGFDYLKTASPDTDQFAALGWSGSLAQMNVVAPGRFGYGKRLGFAPGGGIGRWAQKQDNVTSFVGMAVIIGDGQSNQAQQDELYIGLEDGTSAFFGGTSNSGVQITVALVQNGVIRVYAGLPVDSFTSPVLLAASRPGAFKYGRDFYLEIGSVIDNSSGSVQVRVNTDIVIDVVAADTQKTPLALWNILRVETSVTFGSSTGDAFVDDIYVCDNTGSNNNTYLGNVRVQALLPNAPGDRTVWTPFNGALANWQNAININTDDTLYVFTPNAADWDLYNIQSLVNSPTIFGVQVKGSYRQDDATQRKIQNTLKSVTTEDKGAIYSTDQTYAYFSDIWELNPATGVGFTGAEVNALQIGPYVNT